MLIATPEYNSGIPAALKNAIDWASRAADGRPSVLYHKPIALMGATPGPGGTIGAQRALRQVLSSTDSYVLRTPEVLIARAFERFTADGTLHDEPTRQAVRTLVESLVAWTSQWRPRAAHDAAPPVVAEPTSARALAMAG